MPVIGVALLPTYGRHDLAGDLKRVASQPTDVLARSWPQFINRTHYKHICSYPRICVFLDLREESNGHRRSFLSRKILEQ